MLIYHENICSSYFGKQTEILSHVERYGHIASEYESVYDIVSRHSNMAPYSDTTDCIQTASFDLRLFQSYVEICLSFCLGSLVYISMVDSVIGQEILVCVAEWSHIHHFRRFTFILMTLMMDQKHAKVANVWVRVISSSTIYFFCGYYHHYHQQQYKYVYFLV